MVDAPPNILAVLSTKKTVIAESASRSAACPGLCFGSKRYVRLSLLGVRVFDNVAAHTSLNSCYKHTTYRCLNTGRPLMNARCNLQKDIAS